MKNCKYKSLGKYGPYYGGLGCGFVNECSQEKEKTQIEIAELLNN